MVKPQVLTHVIEGFVIQEGTTLIFYIHIFRLFYIYIYTYIQYIFQRLNHLLLIERH